MCFQVVTQRSAWSDPYHFQVPHTCPPTRTRTWPRQPCTTPTCCRRLAACSLAQVILVAILSLADASPCTCPSLRSAGLRVAPGATRPPALVHIPNLIIPEPRAAQGCLLSCAGSGDALMVRWCDVGRRAQVVGRRPRRPIAATGAAAHGPGPLGPAVGPVSQRRLNGDTGRPLDGFGSALGKLRCRGL